MNEIFRCKLEEAMVSPLCLVFPPQRWCLLWFIFFSRKICNLLWWGEGIGWYLNVVFTLTLGSLAPSHSSGFHNTLHIQVLSLSWILQSKMACFSSLSPMRQVDLCFFCLAKLVPHFHPSYSSQTWWHLLLAFIPAPALLSFWPCAVCWWYFRRQRHIFSVCRI